MTLRAASLTATFFLSVRAYVPRKVPISQPLSMKIKTTIAHALPPVSPPPPKHQTTQTFLRAEASSISATKSGPPFLAWEARAWAGALSSPKRVETSNLAILLRGKKTQTNRWRQKPFVGVSRTGLDGTYSRIKEVGTGVKTERKKEHDTLSKTNRIVKNGMKKDADKEERGSKTVGDKTDSKGEEKEAKSRRKRRKKFEPTVYTAFCRYLLVTPSTLRAPPPIARSSLWVCQCY